MSCAEMPDRVTEHDEKRMAKRIRVSWGDQLIHRLLNCLPNITQFLTFKSCLTLRTVSPRLHRVHVNGGRLVLCNEKQAEC